MAFSDEQRLVFVARAGDGDEVELLIRNGVNPDGSEDNLGAPLFAAIADHHTDEVKVLLENGASVSVTDSYGDGPLEYALHNQDDDSVSELLKYGAKLCDHTKDTYQKLLEQTCKRTVNTSTQ